MWNRQNPDNRRMQNQRNGLRGLETYSTARRGTVNRNRTLGFDGAGRGSGSRSVLVMSSIDPGALT
jgi:hypothetical protein